MRKLLWGAASALSLRLSLGALVLGGLSLGMVQCSNETKFTELEPPQGTFAGGEEIIIHGKNLPVGRSGAIVTFGRRQATNVVMENSSSIKVTSPAGDRNTEVDVTITLDDGRFFQLPKAFRYLDASDNQKVMKNFGNK